MDAWAFEKGVQIEFTRPGKPTDKGQIESFNRKFRDECLNQNVFLSLHDAVGQLKHGGRITPAATTQLIGLADTGRISRKEYNL